MLHLRFMVVVEERCINAKALVEERRPGDSFCTEAPFEIQATAVKFIKHRAGGQSFNLQPT